MNPVELEAFAAACDGAIYVVFGKDQTQYYQLPAVVLPDGRVMTEWAPTEEERQRITQGENIRLWIWTFGQRLQPVTLEVTDERRP